MWISIGSYTIYSIHVYIHGATIHYWKHIWDPNTTKNYYRLMFTLVRHLDVPGICGMWSHSGVCLRVGGGGDILCMHQELEHLGFTFQYSINLIVHMSTSRGKHLPIIGSTLNLNCHIPEAFSSSSGMCSKQADVIKAPICLSLFSGLQSAAMPLSGTPAPPNKRKKPAKIITDLSHVSQNGITSTQKHSHSS